ncbi:F-box protein, partial [Endozoicomonas sp. ONNA2]|uniref:F-box protein n=1 Tax=Endozoicomonas sp. ONNA2 TaxID=2828741 RepID=UPI002147E9CE
MESSVTVNTSRRFGSTMDCATPSCCVGSSNGMSVAPCQAPCSLLHLPQLPMLKLLGYLPLRDILATAKTCTYLNRLITDEQLLARSWFAKLAADRQNQFKEIARDIPDTDLQNWLGQFTTDATVANKFYTRDPAGQTKDDGRKTCTVQKGKYFSPALFFTVSQLMAGCREFEPVLEKRIIDTLYVNNASISTHGDHTVIFRNNSTGTIFGFTGNGQWNQQADFSYYSWVEPEPPFTAMSSFIARGHHILTWDKHHTAKIFACNADHSWAEQFNIVHKGRIISADLSCDGHQVVIT